MNTSKRVIDMTVDELVHAVLLGIEHKLEAETVNTEELAIELNCSAWQIGVYGRSGMYNAPGCRIKRNCWNPRACKAWVATEYKKILRMGNRRTTLI